MKLYFEKYITISFFFSPAAYDEYMKRAFRHPKKNNYRPRAIRKSTRQFLSNTIGENYVNKKIEENKYSTDEEAPMSEHDEDWDNEEPSGFCYDPDCLLPQYDHLTKIEKDRMRFAGKDFCECEEGSSEDEIIQPDPVLTNHLKVV